MKNVLSDTIRVFVVPTDILSSELNIYEKMVYVVLRSYCNAHKDEAFPSYSTIAKLGSMSKRQAIRVVDSLIDKGYIVKETRFKGTKDKITQTSNRYILTLPSKDSDYQSPGVVTTSHQGSDYQSPGVVTTSHQGSDCETPEKIILKDHYIKDDDDDNLPKKIIDFVKDNDILDKLHTIKNIYKDFEKKKGFTDDMFINKLELTLLHGINFESYLKKSIENELEKSKKVNSQLSKNKKQLRKDILPEWIAESEKENDYDPSYEQKKKRAEELLKLLDNQ